MVQAKPRPALTDDTKCVILDDMKEINAVQLRQSLGRLAATLKRTGEPILLKVGREAVGVIITVKDFRERFVLGQAAAERVRLVEEILADQHPDEIPLDETLEELRGRCR
jgi:hypothetical protein